MGVGTLYAWLGAIAFSEGIVILTFGFTEPELPINRVSGDKTVYESLNV